MRYANIVFMQDSEADEILDRLCRRESPDSIVYHGTTGESVREAIAYLSQWDYGDESEHDVRDESSAGSADKTCTEGEYVLSWNLGLSYVGLERILTD